MSAMPVVWCSDPNSSDKKQPFALQGIQLQGNITEKHVLAMKELINAASEGRLLLPTDGAIVLLDCGLSIGSMVIEGKAGKEVAAAANAASNNKSIPLDCPASTNNCDSAGATAKPTEAGDEGGDCNNHNSSSSNSNSSDESDRIASSRPGRVAAGGSDSREQRIEATDRLRAMLERQLGADIDPTETHPTVHRPVAEDGAQEEGDFAEACDGRDIGFPIEANAQGASANEPSERHQQREEEGLALGRVTPGGGGGGPEMLYEFLCCAKCMNDPSSSCSNLPSNRSRSLTALNNSSKLLSRVLNGRAKARLYCDPVYSISNLYFKRFINYKITKSRTDHGRRPVVRKGSGRSERSTGASGTVIDTGGTSKKKHFVEGAPIYATVNKKLKLKSRLDALRRSGHMIEGACGSSGPAALGSTSRRMRHGAEPRQSSAQTLRARRLANVKALVEQQQQLQLLAAPPSTLGTQSPEPTPPDILVTAAAPSPSNGKPYSSASRKTSIDSTCTVSSMDSGFIDQQQRQQLKQQQQQLLLRQSGVEGVDESKAAATFINTTEGDGKTPRDGTAYDEEEKEELQEDGSDRLNDLSRLQIKECLVTQSRNRRKSYEEFKSLFRQEAAATSVPLDADGGAGGHAGRSPPPQVRGSNTAGLPLPSVDEKESVKARRKSYEEFKALVKICDTSFSSLKSTAEEPELRQEEEGREALDREDAGARRSATLPASPTAGSLSASGVGNLFKMKRKNSRRLSLKKPKPAGGSLLRSESGPPAAATGSDEAVVKGSTIYDILRSDRKHSSPAAIPLIKDLGQLALTREEIYRKNYKIYDKLLSYGSKAYKRYDKYMTYGTIYEILHRKSDAAEDVFLRKRALSEKYAKRKLAGGGGAGTSHYGSLKLGTIYDILQGRHHHHQLSAIDCRKTPAGAPATASACVGGDVDGPAPATLSTIYDIIHSKKSAESSPKQTAKNRFLVKKITEEELQLSNENDRNKSNLGPAGLPEGLAPSPSPADSLSGPGGPPSPDYTTPKSVGNGRKPARTRRFSNILSYTSSPKSNAATAASPPPQPTTQGSVPAHESRLGSARLKQIAASDEDLYKSATAKLKAAQQQVQRHQLSVDELYARIGKLRKSATVSSALCDKIDEVAGEHVGDELLSPFHKHNHHQQQHFLEIPDHHQQQQQQRDANSPLRQRLSVDEHDDGGLRLIVPVVDAARNNEMRFARAEGAVVVPQPGPIFKSNSLDMLAPKKLSRTARWSKQMQDAANGWSGPIRKLSPLIMPNKGKGGSSGSSQQKKSTRRLSEFTRGEFLNEKP
uniref:Uncharacterized protein n=1 Tax=Anopheles atroparvus TaxID=41427 RepID=A0A182J0K0_ANOAO